MNVPSKPIDWQLYNDKSILEAGTLCYVQERIHRKSVDPSALKSYDANKDFFLSFFKANLVEGAMDFFGMDNCNSTPTKHIPPKFQNDTEQRSWVYDVIGKFVDHYVFPQWSGHNRSVQIGK